VAFTEATVASTDDHVTVVGVEAGAPGASETVAVSVPVPPTGSVRLCGLIVTARTGLPVGPEIVTGMDPVTVWLPFTTV